MNNWMKCPLQLAKTQHGEVVLHNDAEFQYAFRFGSIHRLLTAEQFHLLYHSALSIDLNPVSMPPNQPDSRMVSPTTAMFTLFGPLTHVELLELKPC
ncbi:hypothetical protein EXU85_26410 [Spirosoma sp. KCTC 42546]|uniref:hypothetical protein n=1 Tax=Spirosoma sp. KCTC 42546 TaxID=2520506 RepID=UPI00115A9931|nr:hypothetical protein [Spirosoma sp. KCTC 42546]QDK81951.1 hypothetical protein EXU85_26410 [Spirosoma sp. KCTC 42546]